MIAINLDLNYLARYLNISAQRIKTYEHKSLEEIVKAEAAAGNVQAQEQLVKVLKDPNALIELFTLSNARNRWKILKELNQEDLTYLLQFLEPKDLVAGLQFFTQDALITALQDMPMKEVLKVVFECYSQEELIRLIPEREINKWFESEKVDPKKVFEQLQTMNPEILRQMMEAVTGQPQEDVSHEQLLMQIENLKPNQFLEGVQSLKPKFKQQIILNMTQEDPKLWGEFGADVLTKPLELLDKVDVIKGMSKLEPENLIKVVENLPQDLLAVVVTQIDPKVFAQTLSKDFQDLLMQVVSI